MATFPGNDERLPQFPESADADTSPEGSDPALSAQGGFTIEDILSRSWEILRSDAFRIIATIWSGIIFCILPVAVHLSIFADPQKGRKPPDNVERILSLLAAGISMLLYAGLMLYLTNLVAGRKSRFGDLFRCRKFAWTILGTYLLMGLSGIGTQFGFLIATFLLGEIIGPPALLIGLFIGIPVLFFVTLSLSQVLFLIVDRETTPLGALKLSWALMRGHRLEFLFLNVLIGLVNLIGALSFGFGLLITVPFAMISLAVFYMAVTGQPVADPFGWRRTPGELHRLD